MVHIDNESLKVLRYIYRYKIITVGVLNVKFSKFSVPEILGRLELDKLIKVERKSVGGGHTPYRSWVNDDCVVNCTALGKATVEEHRLFTGDYIVKSVIVPIIIAIITTLITIILTTLDSVCIMV